MKQPKPKKKNKMFPSTNCSTGILQLKSVYAIIFVQQSLIFQKADFLTIISQQIPTQMVHFLKYSP